MKNFIQRFKNARTVVKQIRAGEWVPEYNWYERNHLTASRDNLSLWIGNGGFFCEIRYDYNHPKFLKDDVEHFGYFWRHYVWWAAAKWLKLRADWSYREEVPKL